MHWVLSSWPPRHFSPFGWPVKVANANASRRFFGKNANISLWFEVKVKRENHDKEFGVVVDPIKSGQTTNFRSPPQGH